MEISKSDWKLFRARIADECQELQVIVMNIEAYDAMELWWKQISE